MTEKSRSTSRSPSDAVGSSMSSRRTPPPARERAISMSWRSATRSGPGLLVQVELDAEAHRARRRASSRSVAPLDEPASMRLPAEDQVLADGEVARWC